MGSPLTCQVYSYFLKTILHIFDACTITLCLVAKGSFPLLNFVNFFFHGAYGTQLRKIIQIYKKDCISKLRLRHTYFTRQLNKYNLGKGGGPTPSGQEECVKII